MRHCLETECWLSHQRTVVFSIQSGLATIHDLTWRLSHMITQHDARIIRELAARVAEIAALPVMEDKRSWSQYRSW